MICVGVYRLLWLRKAPPQRAINTAVLRQRSTIPSLHVCSLAATKSHVSCVASSSPPARPIPLALPAPSSCTHSPAPLPQAPSPWPSLPPRPSWPLPQSVTTPRSLLAALFHLSLAYRRFSAHWLSKERRPRWLCVPRLWHCSLGGPEITLRTSVL